VEVDVMNAFLLHHVRGHYLFMTTNGPVESRYNTYLRSL
jgi:hypothetical protein